jgi:DNA primase
VNGQIWKINVRRSNKSPKYMQIKGGQGAVFGLDTLPSHTTAFLVEGEFDALLLEQEAGDLVGVCTLGSASSRNLTSQWQSHFLSCQRIFLVGDNDQAGRDWASVMSGISHRLKRANVPKGKDISEFWQMGGDLRNWVQEVSDGTIHISNNRRS